MKTNIAILGMGPVGMVHYYAAQAAGMNVVGFSSKRGEVLGGDFTGIPCNLGVKGKREDVTGMHTTSDYRTLLADDNVDAVILAMPTDKHLAIGKEVLQAGKHLFDEKPIAATAQQGHELLTVAGTSGKRLVVGHCLLFFPEFEWLHDTLKHPGAFGELQSLEMYRKIVIPKNGFSEESLERSMGPAIDLGIHDAHAVISGLGMPNEVRSEGTFSNAYPMTLQSQFVYSSNARITTTCGAYTGVPAWSHGFKAVFANGEAVCDGTKLTITGGGRQDREIFAIGTVDIFARMHRVTAAHFGEGKDSGALNPHLAWQAMRIVEAQVKSAGQNGKAVKLAS